MDRQYWMASIKGLEGLLSIVTGGMSWLLIEVQLIEDRVSALTCKLFQIYVHYIW